VERKITLKGAIELWQGSLSEEGELGDHLFASTIYDLLNEALSPEERGQAIDHLIKCPTCATELKELMKALGEMEVATELALAASDEKGVPPKGVHSIEVDDRRFSVLIDFDKSIIRVIVDPEFKGALSGKSVSLIDGKGRLLLKGRLETGELAGRFEDKITNPLRILLLDSGG
jgi:hypothetical protein